MADETWWPGKPIRIIPVGDVDAASEWIPFARRKMVELSRFGDYARRTWYPADGVVIRGEMLSGIPRVFIETSTGYVCSFGLHEDGTSTNLWTGALLSGAAQIRGKSLFGQGITTINNLTPLGDGHFLGGPPLAGMWTDRAQIITTTGGIPTGQAFSPFTSGALKALAYSGIAEDQDDVLHKRFHLMYYQNTQVPGFPDDIVRMPVVVTTRNGGQSFTTNPFYVPITTTSTVNGGGTIHIEIDPVGVVFFGNNIIAAMSYTYPSGTYLGTDRVTFSTGTFEGIVQGGTELSGIHTLLSLDGGLTWESHHTRYDMIGAEERGYFNNVCYIGGSSVIATPSTFGSGIPPMWVLRSDDFGQTFYVLTHDAQVMVPFYGGISPICENSAAYNSPFKYVEEPGLDNQLLFRRTTDGGLTWQGYPFPEDVSVVLAGNIVVREKIVVPDPMPPGKVKADFAKLAVIWRKKPTAEVPEPSYQIGLSDDGGVTWRGGGIINKDSSGGNIGIMDKKLPPFPGYPDLHKNGLPVP
jgi:hypothetical protein